MSIRRRGAKSYEVLVRPFPSRTLPTRKAAEAMELDLKLRKQLGELYEEPPHTFGEEIDGYLARKRATGRLRPRALEFLERSARFWEPFRTNRLPGLRRPLLEDTLAERAADHPRSAKNEREFLLAVLRQAEQRGQRVDRSVWGIPAVKVEEREGIALTVEQLDELASWLPEYVKRIVPFAGTTGLRSSELFTLTEDRVDLKAQTVTIPSRLNKSRRVKPVPLTASEVALLREQLLARPAGKLVFPKANGTVWNRHHFRDRVWVPAAIAAGLGQIVDGHYHGVRVHDLRHTATSLMCMAGMKPELVAERRGDKDGGVLVLRRYRHLYAGEMGAAVTALEAFVQGERAEREAKQA